MSGHLITPNSVALPAGISIAGLIMPNGQPGALQLRDAFFLVILHGILNGMFAREPANLIPTDGVVRLAWAVADAAVAARVQSPATASRGESSPIGGGGVPPAPR